MPPPPTQKPTPAPSVNASSPPPRGSANGATRLKPASGIGQARKECQREIDCPECGHSHHVPTSASSTLCPHCGDYISLGDIEINEDCTARIDTRGHVTVGPKGQVRGVMLRCHDLTLDGILNGGVDCSGHFHLRGTATIIGHLRCRELTLNKGAELTLDYPARADDMRIDGTIHGDLHCEGRLVLDRDAHVLGDITTGALVIESGAHHDGQVHITGQSLAATVSEALAED